MSGPDPDEAPPPGPPATPPLQYPPGPPPPQPGPPWAPPQQGAPQWGGPPAQAPAWGPPGAWGPPPAPYAPAPMVPAKRPLPPFPHPEPREYHQMLRTWNYAWWKPVTGAILVLAGMAVVAPLLLMPVLILGVVSEPGSFWDNFEKAASLKDVGPTELLYLNLTLGSSILVCWLVMRVVHRMRPRWLTSVVPKMRWKFFFICLGLSVVALIAQLIVGQLVSAPETPGTSGTVNDFTTMTALLAVIVLLTTPLQAAGEEYVFRGYLMQAIGSFWSFPEVPVWVTRWVAILGTATLFALAHGVQNFPLFFDRFMFGLIAGWLVVRTGGLEASIAMHILNNFLAFGYALLFSDLSSTLNVSQVGWENIPVTLTQAGSYALLVTLVARKMNLQRRTAPPAQSPPEGEPTALEPVSAQP